MTFLSANITTEDIWVEIAKQNFKTKQIILKPKANIPETILSIIIAFYQPSRFAI